MHSVCPSLWKGSKCEGSRKIVLVTQSQRQGLLFTAFLVVGVSPTFIVLIPESNSDIEGPLKKKY